MFNFKFPFPRPSAAKEALQSDTEIRRAVQGLYRGILRREPDPGIEGHIQSIRDGRRSLAQLIQTFLNSAEYKNLAEPEFFSDQSQYGEVAQLVRLMVNESRDGLVVDVGARGKARSNSWDLMNTFGWRGLLIEANPNLIASIMADVEGLRATVINCAVADYEGEAEFHFGVNDDVSSLTYRNAADWGETKGSTRVLVRRLPSILAEHDAPLEFDILSLDIEGEDIRVLNDLVASDYRPRYVVIEASLSFAIESLEQLPFSERVRQRYEIVARTPANLILRSTRNV